MDMAAQDFKLTSPLRRELDDIGVPNHGDESIVVPTRHGNEVEIREHDGTFVVSNLTQFQAKVVAVNLW